jgi:hypothetical protein
LSGSSFTGDEPEEIIVEALFSMTSAMHMLNETVQDIRDALVE